MKLLPSFVPSCMALSLRASSYARPHPLSQPQMWFNPTEGKNIENRAQSSSLELPRCILFKTKGQKPRFFQNLKTNITFPAAHNTNTTVYSEKLFFMFLPLESLSPLKEAVLVSAGRWGKFTSARFMLIPGQGTLRAKTFKRRFLRFLFKSDTGFCK